MKPIQLTDKFIQDMAVDVIFLSCNSELFMDSVFPFKYFNTEFTESHRVTQLNLCGTLCHSVPLCCVFLKTLTRNPFINAKLFFKKVWHSSQNLFNFKFYSIKIF